MTGSSILPVAIHNKKLYFLFGKENPMEDSAKGFSDFGGSVEPGESEFISATREGSEELTGFLGTSKQLQKLLKKTGVYKIKHHFQNTGNTYTIHIFPICYDTLLVKYFNDNHRFLWNNMDKVMLNDSKMFEKIEIDWFCEDDLIKRMSEYRPFYREIVKTIMKEKAHIRTFIKKRSKYTMYNRKTYKSNRPRRTTMRMKGGQ